MKIKRILVSQPAPTELEKSPYFPLSKKYGIRIDYQKFFQIQGLTSFEFRSQKVSLSDFSAVIFNSKMSVDHFFRLVKDIRLELPETFKYFCISEAITLYLQNYIQIKKRKIFHSNQSTKELIDIIKKHKEDKFFIPTAENSYQEIEVALSEIGIDFKAAAMYRNIPSDLSNINPDDYDLFVFFSPSGVEGFAHNFPNFQQNDKLIAAFGKTTIDSLKFARFIVNIEAPNPKAPSMVAAIEQYLSQLSKRK